MALYIRSVTHVFFFNDTATTEIYTLSLHDALPIWYAISSLSFSKPSGVSRTSFTLSSKDPSLATPGDRKSTRLNSSHANISYAVFCLKKNKRSAPSATPRPVTVQAADHTSEVQSPQ